MADWEGGIISNTKGPQSSTQNTGVLTLNDHMQLKQAARLQLTPIPSATYPDNEGLRAPITVTKTTTTADDSSAYQVYHNDFDSAAAIGTTGRLYIAIKCTTGNGSFGNFYNDLCIGGIQLTSDDYSTLDIGWAFSELTDYTAWEYATVTGMTSAAAGYENLDDIQDAASQTWPSCVAGVSNARISRATGTGSTLTGANNGISTDYSSQNAGTILGSGDTTVDQANNTNFMYTESSGSGAYMSNEWWWIRSPEITLNGESNKNISISIHAFSREALQGGVDISMKDAADNALLRWFWAT